MQRDRLIAVAIGGAAGAAVRWGLLEWLAGPEFPVHTLLANTVACFILGVLVARGNRDPISFGLSTGFCGGLSTMSTIALESAQFLDDGKALLLLGYVAASLIGGYLALSLGRRAA